MNSVRRLCRPVAFSGKGLHSGESSEVVVAPLPAGSPPELEIDGETALLEICTISGAGRGTTVSLPPSEGSNPCQRGRTDALRSARTTEHLFAALAGLGLWSVRISLAGSEIPALDGCSARFAKTLFEASEQEAVEGISAVRSRAFSPAVPVTIVDEEKKSSLSIFPWRSLSLSYIIQYAERPVGTQMAEFDTSEDDFLATVSPARTFALASEVEGLLLSGLAKGGSLENAIVVGDRDVRTAGGLRFPDEFVRHKILDLLGDLYLLGAPLNARVLAVRAGHAMHCRLVDRLRGLRRRSCR